MAEQFDEMTVLALRKFAKDNGIKLPAGLDKQGIIDKLTAEYVPEEQPQTAAPVSDASAEIAPSSDRPIRRASIIADESDEGDDDEPELSVRSAYRPAVRSAVPTTTAAAAPKQGSTLSNISSKAPAFTMEGARAWHNPRTYNPAPTPSYARTQWSTKPVYAQETPARTPVRQEEPRSYPAAAPRTGFGPSAQDSSDAPRARAQEAAPLSAEAALQREFAERESYNAQPENAEQDVELLTSGACGDVNGILDLLPSGCGFIRVNALIPTKSDVFVPAAQIKHHALRQGDRIAGKVRPLREGDRYGILLCVLLVNGVPLKSVESRAAFEDLTPIYPKKKIDFANQAGLPSDVRLIDLISPIGFGQRALLSIPAHAGKTTLLSHMAEAVTKSAPDAAVLYLLLDEKPEEITEASLALPCPLYATTADQGAELTVHACELAIDHAMRLCELKQQVILIVDSLETVMNAYNCLAPQASRTLTGTMSAYAMQNAKKFFAAARNTKEGGSITIIAAIDAASPLTNELSNVANMTAVLDRVLTTAGVFPPIDPAKCATRKMELMLTKQEVANIPLLQSVRAKATAAEAAQKLAFMFDKARTNADLTVRLEGLLNMLG